MIKYNKTNIIVLALIYNYLANKENTIKKTYFELFFNELNLELLSNENKLIIEEEDEQNIYTKKENHIQFSDFKKLPYLLIDLKRKYIDVLPCEVIGASLSPNVLNSLKINRNDIKTKTCLEPKCLSSIEKKPHNNKIKKIIKLNSNLLQPFYNSNLCYSIEREVLDIDSIIEEYESKKKQKTK